MRTILVLCESGYWHDLRSGLNQVGISFLGFDKKKPNRFEIEQLVAKADFVVMRNVNVAHHSVRFAKEACKATNTPFWISHNFGVESIINHFNETFPEESVHLARKASQAKNTKPPRKTIHSKTTKNKAEAQLITQSLSQKHKHLPLKNILKDVQISDEPDFEKMFKKKH